MIQFKYIVPAAVLAISAATGTAALAQGGPPSGMGPAGHHMRHGDEAAAVEEHIKGLHDKLKVTAAEEPQWKPVADVMRQNAKTMHDLIKEKHAKADTMTAVEDLSAYREIAEAHAAAMKNLEAAFGTFYASLSDDQKKLADTVFREHKRHFHQMHKQ